MVASKSESSSRRWFDIGYTGSPLSHTRAVARDWAALADSNANLASGINLHAPWEVLAFGNLIRRWSKGNQFFVRTLLEERCQFIREGEYQPPHSQPIRITCFLPLLKLRGLSVGRVVFEGAPVPFHKDRRPEFGKSLNVDLCAEDCAVVRGTELSDAVRAQIPAFTEPNFLNDELFVIVRLSDSPVSYIIACTEIYRYFFGRTSFVAEKILNGDILDAEQKIWATAEFDPQTQDEATIRWLCKPPSKWNVAHAASFAFDTHAKRHAEEVILWIAANSTRRPGIPLKALPALTGESFASFTFYATPVPGQNEIAVKRINSWTKTHGGSGVPYPFQSLRSISMRGTQTIDLSRRELADISGLEGTTRFLRFFPD